MESVLFMGTEMSSRILADLTVAIHFGYVAFVVLGVPLILLGAAMRWDWVRNRWFRLIHMAMILIVVVEAWAGITCPLTTLERDFRRAAGQQSYQGDFIASWMHEALFIEAAPWMFTVAYTLFGALVVATLVLVPPHWRSSRQAVGNRKPM